MIFYVHVKDGAGNVKWAEVEAETEGAARAQVNNDQRGWRADSAIFIDKDQIEPFMVQLQRDMGGGLVEGDTDSSSWGTFRQGELAAPGENTFGSQPVNPGFAEDINPAVVWRSFLNRAGGPGARSGTGRLAMERLQDIAQSVIEQQANVRGYSLPGAGGTNQATLANLLGAGGLQGVTTEAGNIFNLLASGGGTDPTIVNPISEGEELATGDIGNLARGALLGQNPQSGRMINRLIQMATDQFQEQQRNIPGGPPSGNLADYIRQTIGVNKFNPESALY